MSYGDVVDKVYHAMLNDIKPKCLASLNEKEINELYKPTANTQAQETIRKLIWLDLSNEFFLRINTLTSLLFNKISFFNIVANKRNFTTMIEEKLYSYEINNVLFDTLSKSSQTFKDCNIKFKNIEKALTMSNYNLTSFEPWDVDMNIYSSTYTISTKNAQKYIISAYKNLGRKYVSLVKQTFDNKIYESEDVQSNPEALNIKPYGLDAHNLCIVNDGSISSLLGMSHEIGHLMNKYYSSLNKQPSINNLQKEIAGMVNQTLMFLHLKDKVLVNKKFELCNLYYFYLKQMTNIVSLSNMRLVVKDELNKMIANNLGNLDFSYDQTNEMFVKVKKHYEGLIEDELRWINDVNLSKLINIGMLQQIFEQYHLANDIEYVIGAVIALNIAFDIYQGDAEAANRYLEFLKIGIDKTPIEAIKVLGYSLSNNGLYGNASKNLNKLIDEFRKALIG